MQKIPLELATPGMKLVKPVTNKRGMPLCGEGTELTEAVITRLSDIGVERVTVEGHPLDAGPDEKTLGRQMEELLARFRRVEGDPLMSKIRDIFLERLKERAGEQ